jgi:hypothetical protein
MSDTVNAGIMRPIGVDYLSQFKAWQDLQQAQAQTALTQQQTQGAAIGNQLQNLNLQRTGYLYGLAGVPGVGPNAPGPAPAAQSGFLPGGGAPTAPVSPVTATPLSGVAPGAPAAPSQGAAGGQPWPGQASYERYGVPLDPLTYAQVATSQDPTKAKAEAVESRRQILFSMANVPTDQFPQVAQAAFNAGLITPQMLQNSIANPSDTQSRVLQAFKDPESHASAVAALTNAGVQIDPNTNQPVASSTALGIKNTVALQDAAAKAGVHVVTVPEQVFNPATGQYETQNVTTTAAKVAQAADGAGPAAPTGSALANPNAPVSAADWNQRLFQSESGGAPGARNAQPGQSAAGLAQFTDGTWHQFVASQHPELAAQSPAQISAMKTDPANAGLQAEAAQWYAAQNAPKLAAADVPVNSMTLALAHHLGPNGAASVMNAPANTPIGSIIPADVLKVNPDLQGKTTGQVIGSYFTQFGVGPMGGTPAPASAPAGGAPAVPGIASGVPVLGAAATAGLGVAKSAIDADRPQVLSALDRVNGAQQAQTQIMQLRDKVPQINAGTFADARQGVQNFLATFAPEAAQKFVSAITAGNIDGTKAGDTQEFVKLATNAATAAESQTFGKNAGLGTTEIYMKAFPNLGMQPAAIKDMANLLSVAQQRIIDYGQGKAQFFNDQQQAAVSDPRNYQPTTKFDQQFAQSHPPQVYAGAAAALNGHPYAEWSKGMTTPQQIEALKIAARTDPNVTAMGPNGPMKLAPAAQ